MIILGYPAIGKTTLCKNKDKVSNTYIDLESSCFSFEDNTKPNNWQQIYVNVLEDLSKQNLVVFSSTHLAIREEINKRIQNKTLSCVPLVVYPSLEIKDEWINKLRQRYKDSNLIKDLKALQRAEKFYDEDINDLMKEKYFYTLQLTDLDYDLGNLLEEILNNHKM